MKIQACLRSGWCCKERPCGFGEWNADKTQCKFLGGEKPGEHFCGKYEEIIKDPSSYISPAFGAGCCAPLFNTARNAVVKERGGEEYVELDITW